MTTTTTTHAPTGITLTHDGRGWLVVFPGAYGAVIDCDDFVQGCDILSTAIRNN